MTRQQDTWPQAQKGPWLLPCSATTLHASEILKSLSLNLCFVSAEKHEARKQTHKLAHPTLVCWPLLLCLHTAFGMAQEPRFLEDPQPGGGQRDPKQALTSVPHQRRRGRGTREVLQCCQSSAADTAEVVLGTISMVVGRTECMCTYELGNTADVVLRILHMG